jgi:hypothetical protein
MPAVELQEEKVEAREIRTNSVLTRSSWQGASFPVENFKGLYFWLWLPPFSH